MRKPGSNLLLFHTDKSGKADDILKKQNAVTEEERESLRKMKAFVQKLEKSLLEDNYDDPGSLLRENWMLKKSLVSGVSNSKIDEMYDGAIKAGAPGGKICGAGEGAFSSYMSPWINRML